MADDPEIAETTAYAINQGVVRSGGNAVDAQLSGGRKTFAKTGTNEDTYMLTGGFIPQVATFVAVGNAESPQSFNYKTINGVYRPTWYGMYIAEPAWKQFMQQYVDTAGIPIDNSYGNASSKYTAGSTTTQRSTTGGTTTQQQGTATQQQGATTQQQEATTEQQGTTQQQGQQQ